MLILDSYSDVNSSLKNIATEANYYDRDMHIRGHWTTADGLRRM